MPTLLTDSRLNYILRISFGQGRVYVTIWCNDMFNFQNCPPLIHYDHHIYFLVITICLALCIEHLRCTWCHIAVQVCVCVYTVICLILIVKTISTHLVPSKQNKDHLHVRHVLHCVDLICFPVAIEDISLFQSSLLSRPHFPSPSCLAARWWWMLPPSATLDKMLEWNNWEKENVRWVARASQYKNNVTSEKYEGKVANQNQTRESKLETHT